MKIKLTPVPIKNTPKSKYFVEVTVMHGDADKYETLNIPCDDEDHFLKIMAAWQDMPEATAYGGDEDTYDNWCEDTFGDWIPRDVVYDCTSTIDNIESFYYDKDGVKFKAELV